MRLSLLASLDLQCRQQAAELLADARPSAVVVVHDLLEGSEVLRRVYRAGELTERSVGRLEQGCLSCTVRRDVVPTVRALIREGAPYALLALPPGVELNMVIEVLLAELDEEFSIDNAVLSLDPAELEEQLWNPEGLSELRLTCSPVDQRTPGEFLVAALAQSDTVLRTSSLAGSLTATSDPNQSTGLELLAELAPHAVLAGSAVEISTGCFDLAELRRRQVPGEVRVAKKSVESVFCTVKFELSRPMHPDRFRLALPQLTAGSCWLRGRFWLASSPWRRVALRGIGPRLWLGGTGGGLADPEQPESLLALTGRSAEIIETEVCQLLESAQISDAESQRATKSFDDPFGFDIGS